ncbi:MAG: PAS domain-containing protein [Clostridia bacterium]|nr:PAS domain-containing protein [Clostridia bacterium]
MPTGDSYSPATAKKYLDAYQSDKLSFFEEISEWGDDYTGLLPLHDSQGNRVAALCVDVDVTEIHRTLRNRILESISLIVLLGIGFIVVFIVWAGRNVTRPIEQLERSAVEFASKCRDQKDAEALKIETPDIRVDNEIATLAGAVSEMSEAMRDYVKGMATAEKAARDAETIAELRESISALFDNMPGITFSKDANTGVYLACNQAFAEYAHRQSPEEVVGLTDADFFDPATAEHIAETDRQAIAMDEPCTFYEHVLDATGRQRHLQTTKLKYVDPAGRQCVLGMCADVTDTHAQMQANSMITAMAADYRCVYYVNLDENDGVCYRDDPSDSEQTPAGVHFPYLERFTWYAENSVAEMYREGFLEFINPDNLRRRLSTQPLIAYRYLAKRENREYYEMIRAAGVRRAEERDDHTVHAIGLGLTKIDKEMRETMAKNEALAEALTLAEEASKAKTTFLSNMSHEIRTSMNAIIGLDTLALRDETLTPQTREYMEKIGGSARHLLALINDILDMSRIESGWCCARRNSPSAACWSRSTPWSCPSAATRACTTSAAY